MQIQSLITDLAFILLLGALVTVIFKWIKQPVVLGYIVAGFLASPHFTLLPSVTTEANIDFWAQIGIIVLLFSLGLEFSFKKLVNSGASAMVTALIIICGMTCCGFAIGRFMGFNNINSLFLGGMLSMSSTTIILKAFTDLGLRQKKFASQVLAVLIVEDLFAVVMMVLLSSIATSNGVEGTELVYSVLKLVFFLVIWFLVGVYILPSALTACRRFLNDETLLIVSMGLCLGMAVFSVYCGFSLALGAFVMGSILAGTTFAERIETVVSPVRDLFGAVFFISVGMMVQPSIVAMYWWQILILSSVVIVGMIVFGTFGMLVTGQTLKVAIQSGFSLTQIGEFAFIIATLGMSLGVLNPTIYPIVVTVSVLTTFTTPYFIKMSEPLYNFVERHLPERLRFLIDRYADDASAQQARRHNLWRETLKRYMGRIIIYTVILVAIQLLGQHFLAPLADDLSPKYGSLITMAVELLCMSPFLAALVLPLSRVMRAGGGITIADVALSIICSIIALFIIVNVITTAYSMAWGMAAALALLMLAGLLFSRRVRRSMSDMETRFMDNLNERELVRTGRNKNIVHDLHLAYMTVGSGCDFVGERLKTSNLRTRFGVNIVSVQRGPITISVPGGERRIFPGDVLGVIGTDEQIAVILPHVEKEYEPSPDETAPRDFNLLKLQLSDKSPLIGKTPRNSGLRDNYDTLVVAIQRGDTYIDQNPDIAFTAGDILWLVGPQSKLTPLQ